MNKMMKLFAVVIASMLMFQSGAGAATCTTSGNGGTWSSTNTWNNCNGKTPAGGDSVTILNGDTVNISTGTATIKNLTIQNGATLTFLNNSTLSLTGNLTNSGTFTTGGTGMVSLVGNGTQTITGNFTFNNLTVGGNATIAIAAGSAIVVNGTATIPANTPMTVAAGSSFTVGGVQYTCGTAFNGTYTTLQTTCSLKTVTSINTASANPAATGSAVSWTVVFGSSVTGVKISNFSLVMAGGVSGATITSVTGSGTTWTVNATAGTGTGTLGLNMVNVTGISPSIITTMPFVGQVYTINTTGGGTTCTGGSLPTNLPAGTLGFAQSGFLLNTNGGTTTVINGASAPVAASGNLNALTATSAPTVAVTATLPALYPATFPTITGVNGARTLTANATVAAGSYTNITVNGGTTSFSGGTTPTYIQNLTSGAGTTLTFAPGDYYIDSLTVSGNLTVSPAGLVRLFIGTQQIGAYGAAATTGGDNTNGFQTGAMINVGGNPANLQLLVYPLVTYFEFSNNVQFTGIMYQPTVQAGAPMQATWFPAGQGTPGFDLHTGVKITGALYTPGTIKTWGGNTFTYNAAVASAISSFNTCGTSSVDHFLIQHPSTGLTCSSEAVNVSACANATCSSYVSGVSVTLQPGGAVVTTSGTGSVASTVTQTTASTVSLTATSTTTTTGATQCANTTTGAAASSAACTNAMTFSTAGFVITAPNHVAGNVAAVTVEAVQQGNTANRCVPAYNNVTQSVNLSVAYVNPTTSAGVSPTITTGAATTPNAGTVTAVASPYNLVFDSTGKSNLNLTYLDVGQLTLTASGTAPTGAAMTGSGTFIAAPASIGVTGTTAGNIKSGNNFAATVTALTSTNVAAPNFGNETAPESVTLTANLVNPTAAVGGANPGLANNVIGGAVFVSGAASVTNLTWGEVGTITLGGALTSGSYLGSGFNATGVSGNVGLFFPDHFDTAIVATTTAPMPCPSGVTCPTLYNGFVYAGQTFSVQVTAKNLAAGPTSNYHGAFSLSNQVNLTAWDALGSTATQNPGAGTLANPSVAASAFVNGVGSTTTLAYTFGTVPAIPTNIYLRADDATANATVSSLRTAPATSVEGGVAVVSGRIKVSNAYGSEKLKLTVQAAAQYYNGTSWVTSLTDNVSSVTLAANYNVVKNGVTTGTTTPAPTGAVTLTGGIISIVLGVPTGGATGNASINSTNTTTPSYLPLTSGQATFGVYQGRREFIYMRENY